MHSHSHAFPCIALHTGAFTASACAGMRMQANACECIRMHANSSLQRLQEPEDAGLLGLLRAAVLLGERRHLVRLSFRLGLRV